MNKIWEWSTGGMIMTGENRGDWRNPCPVKVILDFITPTILYEVYKWKMWPNNGVDYILTSQELIKHDTASVRHHVSVQKWHKWHTPSLRHALQIMELLRFHFYPRSQLLKITWAQKLLQSPPVRKFNSQPVTGNTSHQITTSDLKQQPDIDTSWT